MKSGSAVQIARFCLGSAALVTALLLPAAPLRAIEPVLHNTGNILGSVVNPDGIAEMGATVQLLNRYQKVIAKTISGPDGRFAFSSLPSDVYSVQVSLPSFLPAIKNKILIEGGFDSLLQIHLASLFSNIEVTYGIPTSAMTDDWKWVLRSSPATRPVSRLVSIPSQGDGEAPPLFSNTRAMLSVNGGDGGALDASGSLPDLGTGFAIATSLLGTNQIRLSGALGQNTVPGPPQLALQGTYTHSGGGSLLPVPEVSFSVVQVAGIGSSESPSAFAGTVPLRALAISVYNQADPVERLHLEYGTKAESVEYQQHAARLSPFARATVDAGSAGQVLVAWNEGGRPDDLLRHSTDKSQLAGDSAVDGSDPDLSGAMSGLGRLPAISERDRRLRLQRNRNLEVGWRRRIGDSTLAATAFSEGTTDGQLNLAGDPTGFAAGNLLTDSWSTTATANIGNYHRNGFLVSSTTSLSDVFELALAYGNMGAFSVATNAAGNQLQIGKAASQVALVSTRTSLPATGTQIYMSYGWSETGMAIPRHDFTTQNLYLSPGLNVCVRQPLPSMFGLPGRLELTANLQNLLAQGYIPLATSTGRALMIAESPRAIRGGLNFIF